MLNNIIIWGAGRIGMIAYFYYKNIGNVCAYIDNDERKWGKELNGVKIYSPNALRNKDATIVIAMREGNADNIAKQLWKDYGIDQYVLFSMETEKHFFKKQLPDAEIDENTCIVYFGGGLGNQMFQYAFYKALQLSGKNVLAYIQQDVATHVCCLMQTFKSIDLTVCTEAQKGDLIKKNISYGHKTKKFILYTEENFYDVKEKIADTSILNVSGGIFSGIFQTRKFAELAKEELYKTFVFKKSNEKELEKMADDIISQNTVGIHIRRGDYLTEENSWIYGGICTEEYYNKAIDYCEKEIKDCRFVFFSNDIEWVKEHYQKDKALYIESSMFADYHDWYDMYLMSICKHNIIANSTFSWWGAWLNQNQNKIVIAPPKWINICDFKDIYPEEWICL